MERYRGHRELQTAWTYDSVASENRVGSVTEPLLISTESGKLLVPTTLQYVKDINGDRRSPLLNGNYRKEVFDYGKGFLYKEKQELQEYLVWDEEADISILALPLTPETRIFSTRKIFDHLLKTDNPDFNILRRLTDFYPDVDLGLLGSWSSLMGNNTSDFDLYIYGGENFSKVTNTLREREVQELLGIRALNEREQLKYANDYSKRFNVHVDQAKRIALLRSRYKTTKPNGEEVKLAFSGCFDKNEYQMQTILGSRKIKKVHEHGIASNVHNSVSFPREYIVEIDNQPVRVIAMQWVLQKLVDQGDQIEISGTLRENNGVEFISLEDREDVLLAK